MPNLINDIIVRQLSDDFAGAEGMVIVSLKGLTVAETESLRDSLAERGVRLRMVRNRLAKLALKNRGLEASDEVLSGSIACAWGTAEDALNVAKVVQKAIKASDPKKGVKLAFRGGFFEGAMIDAKAAAALAELPGKNELRAMLLGVLSAPARSIATLLAAPGSSVVRAMQAKVDKGETAAT